LGEKFDIHTGGVDHIPVHHPNERAQNIGAFGHSVVQHWVHNEWVVNKDESKLSKSSGNAPYLPNIIKLGFDPMDVRYFLLSINYRTRIQFSLKALEGAKNARLSLVRKIKELGSEKGQVIPEYVERFKEELNNNLNMSEALALTNELLKSDRPNEDILATVLDFDKVLGLDLEKFLIERPESETDPKVENLLAERILAKKERDFEKADNIRNEIEQLGYKVLDTKDGQKLEKI